MPDSPSRLALYVQVCPAVFRSTTHHSSVNKQDAVTRGMHLRASVIAVVYAVLGVVAFGVAAPELAWAQAPGQLPSKTFSVDFQSVTGHTPDIHQITLPDTTIVVEYDAATYVLSWPDHRNHERAYWIKNIGPSRVTGIYYRVKNDIQETHGGDGGLTGLDPGERLQVSYLFDWNRFFSTDPCAECFDELGVSGLDTPRTWSLTVFQCDFMAPDGTCNVPSPTITVTQPFVVRAQNLAQRPLNSTVQGRVYDAVTGQGLMTGLVEVLNPSGEMRKAPFSLGAIRTDHDGANPGKYSISVPQMTAMVSATAPGYQTRYEVATVAAGQTVTVDLPMTRMPWSASYTLKAQVNTTSGLWGWATTPDGQHVVMTPALSGNYTPGDGDAWMINLSDGSLAWKYFLGAQAVGPAISPDGTRVAIPVEEGTGGPAARRCGFWIG